MCICLRTLLFAFFSLTSFALGACGEEDDAHRTSTAAPGYLQIHELYLAPTCTASACHDGDRGIAGLSFQDARASYDALVGIAPANGAAARDGLMRVAPHDVDNSLLYRKLADDAGVLGMHGYGAAMPVGGAGAAGTQTLAAIRAWIEDGAPWDGLAFEPDTREVTDNYVACDATDAAGMQACFGAAPDPTRFMRLFSPPLMVPPRGDIQFCSYLAIETDAEVLFRATLGKQMTNGHHIAVFHAGMRNDDPLPHECTDADMVNLQFVAGAGGAGGQDTSMPPGVSLRIGPARQIVMQSHYINTSDVPVMVMDMVDLELTTREASPTVVDSFAMLDSDFEIPARARGYERVKTCMIDEPMDIYLLLGHTHDHGVLWTMDHVKPDGAETELYHATDGPLLRSNPEIRTWDDPLHLDAGDTLRMTCAWDNDTETPLGWPEEMCVGLMYYGPGRGWLTCDTRDTTPNGIDPDAPGCLDPTVVAGNEIGVGRYCSLDGTECRGNGRASFCLTPQSGYHNYCTIILCADDTECGAGAHCQFDGPGSACLLDMCTEG